MEFGIIRGLLVLSSAIALLPSFKPAESDTEDTVALMTRWEQDATAADLAGDVTFYQKGPAEDWSDGMSNGEFQTKSQLISDFKDKSKYTALSESLSDIKVRVYGSTAIATYTERYDAIINGLRRTRTIITTDTFVKIARQWKQVAAQSSAVLHQPL